MKLKQSLPLLFIIVIALILRLIWLDKVPTGITGDELDYVLNAKAVFLTGKDITGTWSPFSFTTPPYEYPKAELPYLILAPLVGLLNFSLFNAKLTHVIFGVMLAIVIYLIAYKLLGKTQALIAGLLMAINPWSVIFSRTAYDTPLAVFFYFLAFYILLIAKNWSILLAFPIFSLAFFSYIGTKIILIPFAAIIIFYVWHYVNKKRFLKQYIILFLLCITIMAYFIFLQSQVIKLRASEIASPYNPKIANMVDAERHLSIRTPITNLLSNKLVVFTKDSINTYVGAFSPTFLFLYGENSPFFSLWHHGLFYYLDIVFLLFGFSVLFKTNRKVWILLTTISLVAPLPAVVSTVGLSYAIRSSLLYPILVVFMAVGIWYILKLKKNKFYKYSVSSLLILIYLILVVNFLNIYFFRHPIFNSEAYGLSGRILTRYIEQAGKYNKEVVLIDESSSAILPIVKQNLFYTDNYNKSTASDIADLIKNGKKKYKNFKVIPCEGYQPTRNTIIVTASNSKCDIPKMEKLSIARLSDGGEIYGIYNDSICEKYTLSRYPKDITLDDFKIEQLTESRFCEKFITRLE